VIGRRAGTASFTAYSQALKQSGIIWNAQTLDQWLTNPGAFVPGTVMPFAGTADADTRNLLICYLTEKSK
jgi:cytochrome c